MNQNANKKLKQPAENSTYWERDIICIPKRMQDK